MQFYRNKFPVVDEFVMVRVKSYSPSLGINCELVEYSNLPTLLMNSEISRKKIQYAKIFPIGKIICCMVNMIDNNYINLTYKKITDEQKKECEQKYLNKLVLYKLFMSLHKFIFNNKSYHTVEDETHVTIEDSKHVTIEDETHITTEDETHVTTEDDTHVTTEDETHVTTEDETHITTEDDTHVTTEDDIYQNEMKLYINTMLYNCLEEIHNEETDYFKYYYKLLETPELIFKFDIENRLNKYKDKLIQILKSKIKTNDIICELEFKILMYESNYYSFINKINECAKLHNINITCISSPNYLINVEDKNVELIIKRIENFFDDLKKNINDIKYDLTFNIDNLKITKEKTFSISYPSVF
jgi:translation initiation factor 2 alpha subunit (eIF-2alpha)